MDSYRKFIKEIPVVIAKFSRLEKVELPDKVILRGDIDLFAEEGELVDTYQIEIHPKEDYPKSYPLVFETGGRLPHNIDWHVYDDGHWCIGTPAEEAIECAMGITLESFILKEVQGFLYSQTFRQKNGFFYRERSHDVIGSLEYYKDFLELPNVLEAYKAIRKLVSDNEQKSTSKCFCGSNKKYKKCHRRRMRILNRTSRPIIMANIGRIEQILNQSSS